MKLTKKLLEKLIKEEIQAILESPPLHVAAKRAAQELAGTTPSPVELTYDAAEKAVFDPERKTYWGPDTLLAGLQRDQEEARRKALEALAPFLDNPTRKLMDDAIIDALQTYNKAAGGL